MLIPLILSFAEPPDDPVPCLYFHYNQKGQKVNTLILKSELKTDRPFSDGLSVFLTAAILLYEIFVKYRTIFRPPPGNAADGIYIIA